MEEQPNYTRRPKASLFILTFIVAFLVVVIIDDRTDHGVLQRIVWFQNTIRPSQQDDNDNNNGLINNNNNNNNKNDNSNELNSEEDSFDDELDEDDEDDNTDEIIPNTDERSGNKDAYEINNNELEEMKQRLQPHIIPFTTTYNNKPTIPQHQFLHLHHMKTGGTSVDGLMNCGMKRFREIMPTIQLNYTNIHECSEASYVKCISGGDQNCINRVQQAAIMSYCAPLKDLDVPFGWPSQQLPAAITVLRHPVHRVWSMYRFQTKSCYNCRPLIDIYNDIDNNNNTLRNTCKLQLLNHLTRNLMKVAPKNEVPQYDDEAYNAIENMKNVFTMIGITEDMESTHAMVEKVFPWLAENLDIDLLNIPDYNNTRSRKLFLNEKQGIERTCPLPHANSSPKNNHCGVDGKSHWNLPDEPDEETTKIILQHNQQDMLLYEAALQQFELQKHALGLTID